ncbi:ABC transporter permease [Dyella agri]|uniref:ABC transporter permease n=1 Tax=Dyella agri TaxID=1926869 RepID=A0ABW8KC46_9GAMM
MRHIVSPLLRHRLMPMLVVLQVALACAIACNALFLLQQKLVPLLTPDGMGDPGRLVMAWNIAPRGKLWPTSRLLEVRQQLRTLPGVSAASVSGSLPMETNAQMNGTVLGIGANTKATTALYIGADMVDALGLKLVAGRDFSADEQTLQYHGMGMDQSGPAIITRALAQRLFPGESAVGRQISIGQDAGAAHRTVVGVVAHLMSNKFDTDGGDVDYSMLFPGVPGDWPMPVFAVRVAPDADAERVRKAVEAAIHRELGNELVRGFDPSIRMYDEMRAHALAKFKAAVWLLGGVSLVVLVVTMVGIMGLTSYWVQQRTRQIGIRRALGARRRHILRELQLENLLVVCAGVLLGLVSAYAINLWLMHHYELTRLPWTYLPYGAALMLLLGQFAVLSPALRASRVPPVVATRSV